MLPAKYLVTFIAVCVTNTCVVSGEYTDLTKTQRTPTITETLRPEASTLADIEVYRPIPIKTPRPEILTVEEKTPCPRLPTPTFETESDTAIKTPVHHKADVLKTPHPVITLVSETPCPRLPTPTFETESDTEMETPVHHKADVLETPYPMPNAYSPLKSAPIPAPTAPYPTFTLVPETEAPQAEETIKAHSAPAPTIPCPTLTLASEAEVPQAEGMAKAYPIPTQNKESSNPYTPTVTDVPPPSFAEAPTRMDEAGMVVADKITESGSTIKTGPKMTDAPTTDTTNIITTDDVVTTEELGDSYSNSLPAQNRNLRSN